MAEGATTLAAVRRVRDADELAHALALRRAVFAGEQGVDPRADRDGRDGEAVHLVAVRDGAHAQTAALALYERARYRPHGTRFHEEGIEHLSMEKDVA